jgi:ElaB/YqjD/DUF883 family membrane-anchored ribosome-binding protein
MNEETNTWEQNRGSSVDDSELQNTAYEDELTTPPTNEGGPVSGVATPSNGATADGGFNLPSMTDVKQTMSDTASQVKDSAGQALDQAKHSAGQALDAAKQQVRQQLTTQKDRATGTLDGLKQSVQEIGDSFNNHGQAMIGGYAHSLADQVDGVAAYLRESDVDRLTADAQQFARENPAVVLGAAFVIGIAVARFFKSSESNVTSTALVPMSNASTDVNSVSLASHRLDQDDDKAFDRGVHPMSAHGYVSGGVLGGAAA